MKGKAQARFIMKSYDRNCCLRTKSNRDNAKYLWNSLKCCMILYNDYIVPALHCHWYETSKWK